MRKYRRIDSFKQTARTVISIGLFHVLSISAASANAMPVNLMAGQVALPPAINTLISNYLSQQAIVQSTHIHMNLPTVMKVKHDVEQIEQSLMSIVSNDKINFKGAHEKAQIINANIVSQILDNTINLFGIQEVKSVGMIGGEIIISSRSVEYENKNAPTYRDEINGDFINLDANGKEVKEVKEIGESAIANSTQPSTIAYGLDDEENTAYNDNDPDAPPGKQGIVD